MKKPTKMRTEEEVRNEIFRIKDEVFEELFIDDSTRQISHSAKLSLKQKRTIVDTLKWVLGEKDKISDSKLLEKQE